MRRPLDVEHSHTPLSADMEENVQTFRSLYDKCSDVVFRRFTISGRRNAELIYISGLSDDKAIDIHVLKPLMFAADDEWADLKTLLETKVTVAHVEENTSVEECINSLCEGDVILFVQQEPSAVSLSLRHTKTRAVEEPTAESVIKGPREGFTESLQVNTSMLRRRLRTPLLKMESLTVGRYTRTQVILACVETLADETLVQEARNRISRIDIDGVLESEYIEELIEDDPYSPFPLILSTERPDTTVAALLEGRVAILTNNTPLVLIAPTTLHSMLQSAEDYYQRFIISTVIRWLRYLLFIISLILPSVYVAVTTFHQEMVPTPLLLSIASAREGIPFPTLVESLMMEVTFEALREAGIRLPKQIGAAVSIVGALVIGQAAVTAGLVSAPMVIVVAFTGISSFAVPHYTVAISMRLLRFPMMLLAGSLGLLGIMFGVIAIIVHLSTLRSFGVPYLTMSLPKKPYTLKDMFMRAPLWTLDKRPHMTGDYNRYRQSIGQKPGPENHARQ